MATRKSKKKQSTAKGDENSFNYTLNDSYWMDSFDKLVQNVKKPLRERNIFKRKVRVSYNRDSSLENPTTDDEGGLEVVASTPCFKGAVPKRSSKRSTKSYGRLNAQPPPPKTPVVATLQVPPIKSGSNMYFNFVSTPADHRKTDQSLNLSAIVSSEGESSIWKQISFQNISKFFQNKRRSAASPVPGEESRKMLKTPEKEDSAEKRRRKKSSINNKKRTTTTRKSEKPRVLFNLVNEETEEDEQEKREHVDTGRRTENFVLKPGKWRKSIANMRRTIHTGGKTVGEALPIVGKPSVMFDVPEEVSMKETGGALGDEGGAETATGRWTMKGPRLSQYHPGRRRKSIFIPSRGDSDSEVDEMDAMNESKDELLAHLSDDDRDRGLRKPKSSGFFAGSNHGRNNGVGVFGKRSIPVQPSSRKSRQQQVDAELIDLLAERLSLSGTAVVDANVGEKQQQRKRTADGQRDLLNDSSVQLLLHDEEECGSSGRSSSSASVSSDEEAPPNERQTLVVVDDLVVGSKFARQLSKSHSVVVEEISQDIFVVEEKRRFTERCFVEEGDSSDEDEEYEQQHHQQQLARRRTTAAVAFAPESPTRFCFLDGTNQVSVRDTVLRYCDQVEPLRFADVYSERVLQQCRKVGEGVYSEVFMYRQLPVENVGGVGAANDGGKAIVLKVIPIEGELIVNGEVQKKFDEILSEIIISKELSDLRYDGRNRTSGFVNVERVRCVRGKYPSYLVDLWDLYNDNHGSDNDHPEVFGDDQLFIVLELENAGQDLEAFNFTNAVQGYSAFLQTVLTLAVAESKYEFEHRDLHWGNILLRHTDEKEATFVINGERTTVPTEGVQVTIIDYTLSRMLYKRHYLQFNDLAHDEDLFSATGDYQYEIYRLMRKRLANVWSSFEPYTNVLWLHYMIDKLINGARYRLKQSKKHKAAIKQMMKLRDEVPDYKSSVDLAKLFRQ